MFKINKEKVDVYLPDWGLSVGSVHSWFTIKVTFHFVRSYAPLNICKKYKNAAGQFSDDHLTRH